jgi:hypothetical protein
MRKTLHRRQHVLVALQVLAAICVVQYIALIAQVHSRGRKPTVVDQTDGDHGSDHANRAPLLRHCILLTTDVAAQPRDIGGLTCVPFVALPFDDGQFSLLTPDAQAKLRTPFLLHDSGELSNNKSVNIYVNHVRIWRHILRHMHGPTLVLEDDAIVQPHVPRTVQRLLEAMYLDGVRNFIVKLQTNGPHWQFLQWDLHYKIFGVDVRKCSCRPHHTSSSSAAYVIDREAARTLTQSAYPASQHVDVYKHYMGCVYKKINMYAFRPDIVRAHVRPSVHWDHESRLHRQYLLTVEFIDNLRAGTCPIWRQPGVLVQIIPAASSVPGFT